MKGTFFERKNVSLCWEKVSFWHKRYHFCRFLLLKSNLFRTKKVPISLSLQSFEIRIKGKFYLKLKKTPNLKPQRSLFWEKKGINIGIILGKKVSFCAFFVNKNVPFLDKNEMKRYLYFFKKVPTRTYKCADKTQVYTWYIIYINFRKNKRPKKHHFFTSLHFTHFSLDNQHSTCKTSLFWAWNPFKNQAKRKVWKSQFLRKPPNLAGNPK